MESYVVNKSATDSFRTFTIKNKKSFRYDSTDFLLINETRACLKGIVVNQKCL